MRAKVVVDNIGNEVADGEWGLCIYIEHDGKKILLDTGASNLFAQNCDKLGIDISDIDYAVLSHAHYDHSNGTEKFFELNQKAKLYIQKTTDENCYIKILFIKKYVGFPKGILEKYKDRFEYVSDDLEVMNGMYIISHKTPGLEKIAKKNWMYRYENGKYVLDDFSHEQSLVFDTDKGLVIFNSCSHGGADNIINEVKSVFPDRKIHAIVGGFHLVKSSDTYVRNFARRVKETGIEKVYTGHCTGNRAFNILKEELGDKVEQFHVGLEIE